MLATTLSDSRTKSPSRQYFATHYALVLFSSQLPTFSSTASIHMKYNNVIP